MALPEPKYQNSAGRLLAILGAISNKQLLLEALPKLFGVELPKDAKQEKQQACLAAMMDVHKLYLEFRQDMLDAKISEQQRQVLLSGLASIEQSIYPVNMESAFRSLTDAEKSLLEVAATIIPTDAELQKDDIEAIRASIANLRKLVEDANISATIRKVLLDLIRMTEDAISRFNIHGARGLRKAFKAMLAEAAEVYGLASDPSEREELKRSGAWTAIVQHLKTIDAVASRLLKYRALFGAASQFLLGAPPSEPE